MYFWVDAHVFSNTVYSSPNSDSGVMATLRFSEKHIYRTANVIGSHLSWSVSSLSVGDKSTSGSNAEPESAETAEISYLYRRKTCHVFRTDGRDKLLPGSDVNAENSSARQSRLEKRRRRNGAVKNVDKTSTEPAKEFWILKELCYSRTTFRPTLKRVTLS